MSGRDQRICTLSLRRLLPDNAVRALQCVCGGMTFAFAIGNNFICRSSEESPFGVSALTRPFREAEFPPELSIYCIWILTNKLHRLGLFCSKGRARSERE
ncbi:hypothetical protein P153DRAFT_29141 [Dothidotthia symphoricarpi CBS 119687]|uniref:Uncharacterized protein n=1 Tax=Dothidotthia symphoricarpi CBS 119687 TaxID=1392245 RepID=A0A6A6ADL3_9PLEO|nr:uncharacterized protein P153DRAFT_29141 [Dothidotthia symphoricarpi CBS 119687]KAF2128967.1 hypothetical protein P153DRAFT_29141 [Dothidotthia symphoricarpi CBS 119687]